MMPKILCLGCAKFDFVSGIDKTKIISLDPTTGSIAALDGTSFPGIIDTQGLYISESSIIVCHHTPAKSMRRLFGNVEIYNFTIEGDKCAVSPSATLLPNNNELEYVTCIDGTNEWLIVGQAGKNFESRIHLYQLEMGSQPTLVRTLNLCSSPRRNPSGLCINNDRLAVSYYLDNSIDIFEFDRKTLTFSYMQTIRSPLLEAPLSMEPFNSKIFVSSHLNNRLLQFDMHSSKPKLKNVAINGFEIQSPWGMCKSSNKIYLANVAVTPEKRSFITELSPISDAVFFSRRVAVQRENDGGSGFTVLAALQN